METESDLLELDLHQSVITIQAPCKINPVLEITGKRPDGYHELSIIFQTISLADTLTFRPASTLSMTCSDKSLPVDSGNLVMRAAAGMQELLGETRGAKIHLKKVVPTGAGLGGGSSDAAAVLMGLQKLWRRRASPGPLRRLAAKLGADVPFFLIQGLCKATGIGEKLVPMKPRPKTWLVLVYPGFGVSTKEAYAKVRLPFADDKGRRCFRAFSKRGTEAPILFNRFEELVFPDHPTLMTLKKNLRDLGCSDSLMSGSGSSVFGVVESPAKGRRILASIRKHYPQSWLVHTIS